MKKWVPVAVVMAGLILAYFGHRFSRGHVQPVTSEKGDQNVYTDLVGRRVWISKTVNRIILPRSKDIYLLAALLGDELPEKLIAWGPDLERDDSEFYRQLVTRFPRLREIPLTGSVYTDSLDPEQIVQLQPDLVILDKFMLERGYKYTDRLEAAGLPVVYLDGGEPFVGPQKGLAMLGQMLGKQERAETIVRYVDDQIARVLTTIQAYTGPVPTVYCEQGDLGPEKYSYTCASGAPSWGTILERLEVKNIADDAVVGMAIIRPEYVLSSDPDVIVITGQNWSFAGCMRLGYNVSLAEARGLLQAFVKRPGWSELTAVKNKRVHAVFHNTCAITIFSGIQALAKACYPGLFADLDAQATLREFHERFMPIDYNGTWTCCIE